MPIATVPQTLPADKLTLLAIFGQVTPLAVLYSGSYPPNDAAFLEVYLEGTKVGEMHVPGQSVILEGRRFEVKAVGGLALVSVGSPTASPPSTPPPPAVPPTPPSSPQGPSSPAKTAITATILNPDIPIQAKGGTRVDIQGVVGITPDTNVPGMAYLTAGVFDAAGVNLNLGCNVSQKVQSASAVISSRTGMVKPKQMISIHLLVTAPDGSRAEATRAIKTV